MTLMPAIRESAAKRFAPVVVELDRSLTAESVFRALSGQPHAVFFDSAQRHDTLGRYSYVAADPYAWIEAPADGSPAIERLEACFEGLSAERQPELPPWQGGAAGVLGYEIGKSLERLPSARWDEFGMPALAMGVYDTLVAFDHLEGRAWALSQGLPETAPEARYRRASQRLEWLLGVIERGPCERKEGQDRLSQAELAPSYAIEGREGLLSDFSRDGYLHAVRETIELLRAGEAYQVNLSQRLLLPDPGDPVGLYLRLREKNPAPFGGYLDGGAWQLASASPERFLRVEDNSVETRPIKGTRPRGSSAQEDSLLGDQLRASEKDRAENVMIVDLLRNDLSRVCRDDSVVVPTLFGLEKYEHVQHLVSVVRGELRSGKRVGDLLRATLPGGSVTGAPKIRSMEIIAQLEPTARGAYCGAMAWVGLPDSHGRKAMDSSVLIRTLTRSRGWVQAPVGGGVVVQSDPEREYEETWHKAAGLIDAVQP